jgi:HEAT repeat protein
MGIGEREGQFVKPYWVGVVALLVLAAWVSPGFANGIDSLIEDLKTGDEATRLRAVVALGHSGDPKAVGTLREALHDESRVVREYALRALADLLQILEHTSQSLAHWLRDLRARLEQRLEEPQMATAPKSIRTRRE